METEKEVNIKIAALTLQIKKNYPELCSSIGEMPITIPGAKSPFINGWILTEYYESLVSMYKTYESAGKK